MRIRGEVADPVCVVVVVVVVVIVDVVTA